MKKKILIGSLLVLTLLLLMPSIPAIQQKTIEDKAYSDFVEKLEDVDLEDIEVLDDIKLPLIYALLVYLLRFRRGIAGILLDFAIIRGDYYFYIIHPIIFLLYWYVEFTVDIRLVFWRNISNKLGLDWIMDYSIFRDN